MMRLDYELTDSIQQKICEALRIGASYELAAGYAGISVKSFWRWKKEGEINQTSLNAKDHQRYIAFSQDIKKARADYKVACLMKMEKLGVKHWKPLQWKYDQLLEVELQGRKKNKKRRS